MKSCGRCGGCTQAQSLGEHPESNLLQKRMVHAVALLFGLPLLGLVGLATVLTHFNVSFQMMLVVVIISLVMVVVGVPALSRRLVHS